MLFKHIAGGQEIAGNGTDDGVRKHARTLFKNRNCSAYERSFFFIGNVLFALLKNGYRVSSISAKSSLSADMCDRLSF